MDQNKNEEHPSGGPPVTSQHHIDVALSLQEKSHSSDFVPLGEDKRSRPGTSSRRSTHGLFGIEIDEGSLVINGDVRGKHPDRTTSHMISGGSVKNNSAVYNGDLDIESLMKTFGKRRKDDQIENNV